MLFGRSLSEISPPASKHHFTPNGGWNLSSIVIKGLKATEIVINSAHPEKFFNKVILTHMAKIQASYTVTQRHYFDAQNEHVGAFSVKAMRGFGGFAVALAVATLILRPHEYVFIAGFAIFGLWSAFGRNLILRRWYKRDFPYKEETCVSMSDEGVSFISERANTSCHWDRLLAYAESDRLFLLYPTERIFYIVPKVAFQPEQLADVRETLARNVPLRHLSWLKRPWGSVFLCCC